MRYKFTTPILIGIVFLTAFGCSIKWTEAIHYGKVIPDKFSETVSVEIQKGLLLVPITIRGKQYRFLFDSGAPFSISTQLQNDHAFKVISKGNIIDSDHNRQKVKWAQIDSISIGDVSFLNQTAFIGDFDANPILRCLEIDGIIGSNLIRHCNWTIDQEQKSLSLNSRIDKPSLKGSVIIPFKTDYQYNIFFDVNIGEATVNNILMDYGSNGSISLDHDIFTTLKNRDIIGETFIEQGIKQSGIIGQPVDLHRELTFSDSVSINKLRLKKVMLQTGKTVSVGNDLLSRFWITIDWDNKNLYLSESRKILDLPGSPGFRLGISTEKGIYVQSVIENSNAYHKGIRPNMKVLKMDTLDFENGNDFCDYINQETKNRIFLQLIDSTGQKQEYHFEKTILIR